MPIDTQSYSAAGAGAPSAQAWRAKLFLVEALRGLAFVHAQNRKARPPKKLFSCRLGEIVSAMDVTTRVSKAWKDSRGFDDSHRNRRNHISASTQCTPGAGSSMMSPTAAGDEPTLF